MVNADKDCEFGAVLNKTFKELMTQETISPPIAVCVLS